MNAIKLRRTGESASRFFKQTTYTFALLAVTLPVCFAQSETKPGTPTAPVRPVKVDETPKLEGPALLRALEHVSHMSPAKIGKASSGNGAITNRININNVNDTKWEPIGPFGSKVTADGPLGVLGSYVGGRVNGVAYDPKNPNIIYAATAGGGLWRYNPSDVSPSAPTLPWRPLGDKFPSLATYSVVVSPFNSKVVLVGTGTGIQRSINGANTFVAVGTELGTVTHLVFDPDNANTVYATADPAGAASNIYVSRDLGNTWTAIAPTTRISNQSADTPPRTRPIGEEWNDLDFSIKDADGNRYLYATSRRGGLYRSPDKGTNWQLVNAPLVYNPVNLNYNDPFSGAYGIQVGVSLTDPFTIYVMDSNANFSDGRIFVSKDAGDSWTEIGGNYPILQGPNNLWTLAQKNLGMIAIPTLQPDDSGTLISTDALLGATRFTYSTEYSAAAPALYPGRDWASAGLTHIDQKDFSYTSLNPNRVMAANEGGIYELSYDPASLSWAYTNNALNRNLGAIEFYGASFHPTQEKYVLGGTINNGVARSEGNATDWRELPTIDSPFNSGALLNEVFTLFSPNFPSAFPSEAFLPPMYTGSVAYDPNRTDVQYIMAHAISGGKMFVTTDNWKTGWEITPDRTIHDSGNQPLRLNGTPVTAFQQVNGQDGSTSSNWSGEVHRPQGILYVEPAGTDVRTAQGSIVYSGGSYLWRYDLLPGWAVTVNAANVDRGSWRRVGGTALAVAETLTDDATGVDTSYDDYITAIATADNGSRIYVGTHLGRLWMTRFGLQRDGTTPIPALTAPWVSLNTDTLVSRLPQDPVTKKTYRSYRREITAISVNPPPAPAEASDILVGIEGQGVYRCANTLGASFLFTQQNGLGTASLPSGLTISSIVRDTVTSGVGDTYNSFFIGTNIGVFSTNDQGTSWTDATVPLGLPQIPVVTMDLSTTTGYLHVGTAGRGAWRFNLAAATEKPAPPVLAIKYALSRNVSSLYGNVTIENTGGQARNVQITSATLTNARNVQTTASSISPANLGTIGSGTASSRSATVIWPTTAGKRGEVSTLQITVTYDGASAPVSLKVRTRLP